MPKASECLRQIVALARCIDAFRLEAGNPTTADLQLFREVLASYCEQPDTSRLGVLVSAAVKQRCAKVGDPYKEVKELRSLACVIAGWSQQSQFDSWNEPLDPHSTPSIDFKPKRQLARLQFADSHTLQPIFWVHRDGNLIHANTAACRLFGYSPAEIIQLRIYQIAYHYPPDLWAFCVTQIRQQSVLGLKVRYRCFNRDEIHIQTLFRFYSDGDGDEHVVGFVTENCGFD